MSFSQGINKMVEAHSPISRVPRSKEQAKSSYDRMSQIYDYLSGSSERRFIEEGLRKLKLIPGEKCLEIGFGTGHAIVDMARSVGKTGKIYGLDISEGMLKIAEKNVTAEGLSDRVELKIGDAASLPYEDRYFDAIFMSFTLELFDTPEIPIVLQDCHRVLNAGARICVIAMSKVEKPGFAVRIYEWAHMRFPTYVDCRPIYATGALRDAGFFIEDVTSSSMWGLPVEIVLARKPE
jgi:ubiquinone/menaquinone biosynthesis C-methylase UbiE